MDLYTIGSTIEPPIVWYIQKCMLIWKICFYFSFVLAICSSKMRTCHVIRDLFTEKVLSCWYNFNSRDLFHTLTEDLVLWILVVRILLRMLYSKTRSTTFCPPSRVCEGIVRVQIVPAPEHLFRESVVRNMARLHFWRTDRLDKTKIKTNSPYQHTLLNIPNDGGLNCASDGI